MAGGLPDIPRYYDRQGNPIKDTLEWGRLFEDWEYRLVAMHEQDGGWKVTTIWTGLDQRLTENMLAVMEGYKPLPAIFRTATIGPGWYEESEPYPTEAAALAGHDQAVAALAEKLANTKGP
jgi:hypothetical protein